MTTKKSVIYCDNCDNEALYRVLRTDTFLCQTCHDAYQWGQNNPQAIVVDIEDDDFVEGDGSVCENCGEPAEYDSVMILCEKCEKIAEGDENELADN